MAVPAGGLVDCPVSTDTVISLLFIALTVGVSLYFGLYYGKHDSQGDYCKLLKV